MELTRGERSWVLMGLLTKVAEYEKEQLKTKSIVDIDYLQACIDEMNSTYDKILKMEVK